MYVVSNIYGLSTQTLFVCPTIIIYLRRTVCYFQKAGILKISDLDSLRGDFSIDDDLTCRRQSRSVLFVYLTNRWIIIVRVNEDTASKMYQY